jgi:hypothetical protein
MHKHSFSTARASLDTIRIAEQSPICRSGFCRNFQSFDVESGELLELNCKSWRCERCRVKWGKRWGCIIGEQLKATPCNLLLNLTTSSMISNLQACEALRFFMRSFRSRYGKTEYVKVVEYNKNHTQPHFHLLLINPTLALGDMPLNYPKKLSFPTNLFEELKILWEKALRKAAPKLPPTTVVWCQPPRDGAAAANYAIGYITGKADKNEEPDSTWLGRKLSYSRDFFSIPTYVIWEKLLYKWFGEREDKALILIPIDIEAIFNPINYNNLPKKIQEGIKFFLYLWQLSKRSVNIDNEVEVYLGKNCGLPLFPLWKPRLYRSRQHYNLERGKLRC